MSKSDDKIMVAIVAGGVGAVAGALFMIAKAKSTEVAALQGLYGPATYATQYPGQVGASRQVNLGATIGWQAAQRQLNGIVNIVPRPSLRGWGTPGFGRSGRGTGAAVYWRQVA